MTASKHTLSLLTRIRRTVARTWRRIAVSSCTLTLSVPPFFKLEIKTEPKPPKRRRRAA